MKQLIHNDEKQRTELWIDGKLRGSITDGLPRSAVQRWYKQIWLMMWPDYIERSINE